MKYEGEWQYDSQNGQGTMTYSDGRKYVGGFKGLNYHGQGTLTYPDGRKYVGEWRNSRRLR